MRRAQVAAGVLVSMTAMSMAVPALLWSAEESSDRASRSARSGAAKPAHSDAEASSDLARLERQVEEILEQQQQILANQQTILQRFDAVMEELRIVKVRASQAR